MTPDLLQNQMNYTKINLFGGYFTPGKCLLEKIDECIDKFREFNDHAGKDPTLDELREVSTIGGRYLASKILHN